jgi:predicted DCC family thiol-disulfide oxidoreductase YuxK
MILVFVCLYFFPGAWKVARWWGNWFTSQNMYLLISGKLSEIEATPIRLWVLSHPWALMAGAIVTVLFEVGFIFLLLGKRIRPLGIAVGLAFHNVTALLMGITFFSLQVAYAVLVDWSGILSWIGRHRKLEPITILYDPHCKLCRRTMGVLSSIDWLDLLKPAPNSQPETWTPELRDLVGDQDISNRFAAADAPRHLLNFGYDAYIEIARRLPLLWWFAPIMRLAPVRSVGEVTYERVANSRTCSFRDKAEHRGITYIGGSAGMLMKMFSAVVLFGMVLTGVGHRINAWPLACFPTFDNPPYVTRRLLHVDAKDVNGHVYSWDLNFDAKLGHLFGTERWQGMLDRCVQGDSYTTSGRCRAILGLWCKFHPTESPLSEARFVAEEHAIGYLEDKGVRARFPLLTLTNGLPAH